MHWRVALRHCTRRPRAATRGLAFNPLFAIDVTIAMSRDDNGRLRRPLSWREVLR